MKVMCMRWSRALGLVSLSLCMPLLVAPSPDTKIPLVHKTKYAMGTVYEIAAFDESPDHASAAIDKAFAEIVRLDNMLSNYKPDASTQVEIFRKMALLKANDERARKVIRSGRVVMTYYSYRGQEVIPAAMSVNLADKDYVCTIYRGIHDMVSKDMPLRPLWAEIAGRVNGTCKGKGGPMHLTHPASGVMVTTGVVGSSMPIANGLALAAKLDKSRRVAVAYFGDGASNIGAFHESLNLASVWKLPVIFVCQNNGFAEHTRYENGTAVDFIAKRAIGYSMPGFTVNGNDPFEMYAAANQAINRARDGEGPTLLECKTLRFLGHVFGGNQNAANQGLGQVTGIGQQNAGQLMAILAPMVMAALANHVQNQGLNPGGLGGLLTQQSQQIQQGGGLVGGLLNAVLSHGGGNLDLSHLVQGAGGLLGAFARR